MIRAAVPHKDPGDLSSAENPQAVDESRELVKDLRAGLPDHVLVSGDAAQSLDFADRLRTTTPLVIVADRAGKDRSST